MDHPAWVRKYIGTPFIDKGRSKLGYDCYGLARAVWVDEYRLTVPDYLHEYNSTLERKHLQGVVKEETSVGRKLWYPVQAGQEREGDGVLIRILRYPMHIGIVTKPGWMIHCERDIGTALERYDSPFTKRKVVGFYRHTSLVE